MTSRKPDFVTFTGVDQDTDLVGAINLSQFYPIEWGFLYRYDDGTAPQLGEQRYTGVEHLWGSIHPYVQQCWPGKARVSLHVCGKAARDLVSGRYYADSLDGNVFRIIKGMRCKRVQINVSAYPLDLTKIAEFGRLAKVSPILQCCSEFPSNAPANVQWLFDKSRGRGIVASDYPTHPGVEALVGYAGGITPDNVLDVIEQLRVGDHPYWIDMETGVRDTLDRFDLGKCEAVCRKIWGEMK